MQTGGVCVIGGSLVGLATALQWLRARPGAALTLLKKEPVLAAHQSTHNSGVLHAGLSYQPDSAKAALAARGIRLLTEFCGEYGISAEICGKVVIATQPAEIPRLRDLEERGRQNGLTGLRRLPSPAAIRELEPHAAGIEGLHVPEEGIVDYAAVARAMAAEIERAGGRIVTAAKVGRLVPDGRGWTLETTAEGYPGL